MAIFSKLAQRGTFGDINWHVLVEVAVFIEEGNLVGLDEILDVADEEGLVFLEELGFIVFDVFFGDVEDLAGEHEPFLVGLEKILFWRLCKFIKFFLVCVDNRS